MNIKEHKLEFTLLYILGCTLLGVLIWFILETVNFENSIELATLISLSLIVGILIFASHGKGLLPDPKTRKKVKLQIKLFRAVSYSRENFQGIDYQRKKYRNINNLSTDEISEIKHFLPFDYTREKYRK